MNQDQVEVLEQELEIAIGRVVRRLAKAKQISVPPNRTYHLMAKAAVAVLEAVILPPPRVE